MTVSRCGGLCFALPLLFFGGVFTGYAQTFVFGASLGTIIASQINEASGLIASRQNPGVLWVHNDSGYPGTVFAISTNGALLGSHHVPDAPHGDYEDIAMGPGPSPNLRYIYLGDIGDNSSSRSDIRVFRFPEPAAYAYQSNNPPDIEVVGADRIVLTYPDGAHNCEAMMVDPITGDLFLATKGTNTSRIYRAPRAELITNAPVELTFVREIVFKSVSGADVSSDGSLIIVRRAGQAEVWKRAAGKTVGDAFAGASVSAPVIGQPTEPNGEAIGFHPTGLGYYTLSEGLNQPIYYFRRTGSGIPVQPKVFVKQGDTWRYNDSGSDLGTNWFAPSFNDQTWSTGAGQLGYGQGDEKTTIAFGPDDFSKNVTSYFLKTFSLSSTNGISSIALLVLFNDGITVYFNGAEVLRRNLPAHAAFNAPATEEAGAWQNVWQSFSVNPGLLRRGTNTVAVELHRFDVGGPDLSFDLQLLEGKVNEAIHFASGPKLTNNVSRLSVSGPAGFEVAVEASADFVDWTPIAQVVLTNGSAQVVDNAPTPERRFYRLK
jgi:hypothetical protein